MAPSRARSGSRFTPPLFDLLFVISTYVLLTLLFLGRWVVSAVCLTFFEYRPVGWVATHLVCLYYLAWLLSLILSAVLLVPRASRTPNVVLILGAILLIPYLGLFLVAGVPKLQELNHSNTWPAELELSHFEVCTTKTEKSFWGNSASGKITVEIKNLSQAFLREATFTVTGHHVTIRDLPPGGKLRAAVEAELGNVFCKVKSGRCTTAILWDRVRYQGAPELTLAGHPYYAEDRIDDCQDGAQMAVFSLTGTWVSKDGTGFQFKQEGDTISGIFSGGPFSAPGDKSLGEFMDRVFAQASGGRGSVNRISGKFDGQSFKGQLWYQREGGYSTGDFTLKLTGNDRLEGGWLSAPNKRGSWNLTRAAPGSYPTLPKISIFSSSARTRGPFLFRRVIASPDNCEPERAVGFCDLD